MEKAKTQAKVNTAAAAASSSSSGDETKTRDTKSYNMR